MSERVCDHCLTDIESIQHFSTCVHPARTGELRQYDALVARVQALADKWKRDKGGRAWVAHHGQELQDVIDEDTP